MAVSVRARSAIAAMGAVSIALVLASLALLVVLHDSVRASAVATATARAHDVAAELRADGAVTSGLNLSPGFGDASSVTVLDDGQVVATSESGVTEGPVVTAVIGVPGIDGADQVVVQQSYESGAETVTDAAQALLVAVPLLVLLVGALAFVLTGRALRPVEKIRARTAQISHTDLGMRVDVPSTGDEVARLAVTLNEMLERLDDAQRVQDQFVADASHELRSPLAAVRVELEVAARRPGEVDWATTLASLRGSNARMEALVDDLLVLSRASESSAVDRGQEVDLDEIVERVGFAARTPSLSVEVRSSPVRARGSAPELERVVQNLVENACRHASSRVRLTVRSDAGEAVVEVDDDGSGIPEADRSRVFDRFVRLDEGRARAAGGAGLGLAIVAGIVGSHSGSVHVVTSDLGGTRVVVRVPLAAQVSSPAIR
ncbi:HAMP domain-containing sensor histidine kinase [Cellulomonas sp. PhB150]|uniref:HAMP domain-containing sensor histidine kinase n=1 Tax=Cellulomonas sp. PhB150 TaxID=2485188 RepID=UPI000F49531E|nr:HAMP domain-containing sensor histidine kinase [Cellulomonas sp. PhB150]ROS30581.1 signal transduction histidine kinase [Cellulomonas sp. PhB150]